MSSASSDSLHDVVHSLYEAALDDSRWHAALRQTIAFEGGSRGGSAATVINSWNLTPLDVHEVNPDLLVRFGTEFGGVDPCFKRTGPADAGTVLDGAVYSRFSDWQKTDIYRGFFDPAGMHHCLVTVTARGASALEFLGVYRSRREGPFRSDQERVARVIAPHLARASSIRAQLARAEATANASQHLLARLPFGVVALDDRGRVLFANARGEQLLRDDRVRVRHSDPRSAFSRALASAIARALSTARGRTLEGASFVQLPRDGSRPLQVLVAPAPRRASEVVLAPHFETAVLLLAVDPALGAGPTARALREVFGLTPTLSRLAAALAAGKSLAAYADEAHVTVGTARAQLKEVFARTNTSRQADLVRALLTSVAALAPDEPHEN